MGQTETNACCRVSWFACRTFPKQLCVSAFPTKSWIFGAPRELYTKHLGTSFTVVQVTRKPTFLFIVITRNNLHKMFLSEQHYSLGKQLCVNFANSWLACFFMIICVCLYFSERVKFINNKYISQLKTKNVACSVKSEH